MARRRIPYPSGHLLILLIYQKQQETETFLPEATLSNVILQTKTRQWSFESVLIYFYFMFEYHAQHENANTPYDRKSFLLKTLVIKSTFHAICLLFSPLSVFFFLSTFYAFFHRFLFFCYLLSTRQSRSSSGILFFSFTSSSSSSSSSSSPLPLAVPPSPIFLPASPRTHLFMALRRRRSFHSPTHPISVSVFLSFPFLIFSLLSSLFFFSFSLFLSYFLLLFFCCFL